jgi:hypothetical protein
MAKQEVGLCEILVANAEAVLRCQLRILLQIILVRRYAGLNKKTIALLQSYSWPGNVREQQKVIEPSIDYL